MDKSPRTNSLMMLFAKVCMYSFCATLTVAVGLNPLSLILTNSSKVAAESLEGASVTRLQMVIYFYGVLMVRFLWFLMKTALNAFSPYYRSRSIEHQNKTATMLIKGVYYFFGFFYMVPLTCLVGQSLVKGVLPTLDPFWSHYWTLTGTVLNAFYIFEVVIPFSEDWTLWLHHMPVFFLTLLWTGLLPGIPITSGDRDLICLGYGIPVLQFTCMNAMLNLFYGYRHLQPPTWGVVKALRMVSVEVTLSTALRNLWLYAWAFVYHHKFDNIRLLQVILFIDFFWTLHNVWIIRRTETIRSSNKLYLLKAERKKNEDQDVQDPVPPISKKGSSASSAKDATSKALANGAYQAVQGF